MKSMIGRAASNWSFVTIFTDWLAAKTMAARRRAKYWSAGELGARRVAEPGDDDSSASGVLSRVPACLAISPVVVEPVIFDEAAAKASTA